MKTETIYQPRITGERFKLWVPHNDGEIAFAYPSIKPQYWETYQEVGERILEKNQEVPIGDYMASLLHVAYGCTKEAKELMDKPEFEDIRYLMKKKGLWIYNRNIWTKGGVYVILDEEAVGMWDGARFSIDELEKRLKGGKELSWGGIRFSRDGKVRFAPIGSYNLGENTPKKFAKDGFIIASCKEEGAEKLGEVSAKFKDNPYIRGFDLRGKYCPYGFVSTEGVPQQRVSVIYGDDSKLNFIGWDCFRHYDPTSISPHAFGVLK